MRNLTAEDTPFLCKILDQWAASFPVALNRTQLITWAEQYPDEVIQKGVNVTAGWYKRQSTRSDGVSLPTEEALYRYASGCMRNVNRARSTAEQLLGGVR